MKKEIINDREVISVEGARYHSSINLLQVKGSFRFMNVTKKNVYKGVEQKYRAEIVVPHSDEMEKLLKFIYNTQLKEVKGDKTAVWIKKIFGDKRSGFVYDPELDEVDFDTLTDKEKKNRKELEGKFIVKASCLHEPKLFIDERTTKGQVYALSKEQYAEKVGQWDGFGCEGYMSIVPYEYDSNVFAHLKNVSITKINTYDDSEYYDPDTGKKLSPVPYPDDGNLEGVESPAVFDEGGEEIDF